MSAVEFLYAANVMVDISTSRYSYCRLFAMGGTPLNEALITLHQILPQFHQENR